METIEENVNGRRVISDTELFKLRNSLAKAVKALDSIIGQKNTTKPPRQIQKYVPVDFIIDGICSYYGITFDDLTSYRRNPYLVQRRKITAYVLRKYTNASLANIAGSLRYKKNSASVMGHIRDVEYSLSNEVYGNKEIIDTYKNIINHLNL